MYEVIYPELLRVGNPINMIRYAVRTVKLAITHFFIWCSSLRN